MSDIDRDSDQRESQRKSSKSGSSSNNEDFLLPGTSDMSRMYSHLRERYMPHFPEEMTDFLMLNEHETFVEIDNRNKLNAALGLLRASKALVVSYIGVMHPLFAEHEHGDKNTSTIRSILNREENKELREEITRIYDYCRAIAYNGDSVFYSAPLIPAKKRVRVIAMTSDSIYQFYDGTVRPLLAKYSELLSKNLKDAKPEKTRNELYM